MKCKACGKENAVNGWDLCKACGYCLQALIQDCTSIKYWPKSLVAYMRDGHYLQAG